MSDFLSFEDGALVLDLEGAGLSDEDFDFQLPPNGDYNLRIQNIDVKQTKNNDDFHTVDIIIVDGDHQGKSVRDAWFWKSRKGNAADRVKAEKTMLRMNLQKIAAIIDRDPKDLLEEGRLVLPLEELYATVFRGRCKTEERDGYKNFNLQKVLKSGGNDAPPAPKWEGDDELDEDEIPF
jgi:hypothetical protein